MKRKHFLSAMMAAGAALPALGAIDKNSKSRSPLLVPHYLRSGDRIGITAPAGFITVEEIQPAIQQMESWGFTVRIGNTIGKKDFTFGGTDEERVADLQQMLDDPSLQAIMCARGGYGAVRIIDRLDFSKLQLHPKWIIGFSDITVIHHHLERNYNIASIHSKMCNSFPDDWTKAEPDQVATILSIKQALSGEKLDYPVVANEKNRLGVGEGALVGGNLKTIESLSGSPSALQTAGKILFVEDTGEYLYSIDRMFWNLERTGRLNALKGLIIGGFKIKPDDPGEEFGKTIQDIVLEKVKQYNYPVCFDFPVGHQKNNYAIKHGIVHRLEVRSDGVSLREV